MPTTFEDEHLLRKVREYLWAGREFGRASVMIGAGFSRNAEGVRPSTSPFPLWRDLAKAMHTELYPDSPVPEMIDALRLADEYEHVFKRAGLEDFLLRKLEDNSYAPGALHRKLLSLPWADVFTTNYDTLLERAANIPERRYTTINTSKDIAAALRPRIIKLHGSFPSHRPFIFASEDYRTYPKRFAPLVNTVQQSMMESALCLIGFSGDDPNFKAWVGWIHDNLGSSAPPIYMFGLLDLNVRERMRLERLNVFPVDIGPKFPRSESTSTSSRHLEGLHWLLDELSKNTEKSPHDWPGHSEIILTTGEGSDENDAIRFSTYISSLRETYPNWLSCPNDRLYSLTLRYHQLAWGDILGALGMLPPLKQLEILALICWYHQMLRIPLSLVPSLYAKVLSILDGYLPAPIAHGREDASSPSIQKLDGAFTEHWIELAFAVMRNSQEIWDVDRFERTANLVEGLATRQRTWSLRLRLERARFALNRLDFKEVQTLLDDLGNLGEDPSWVLHRLALAAEARGTDGLAHLGQEALQRIRTMMPTRLTDYYLPSLEGSAMFHLWQLVDRLRPTGMRDRWAGLEEYNCNPWGEIQTLRIRLIENDNPRIRSASVKTYDPMTFSQRTTSGNDRTTLVALQALRWIEDSAFPVRWGHVVAFEKIIGQSCSLLVEDFPCKSLAYLCRNCDSGTISSILTRGWVMSCPQSTLDIVAAWSTTAFEHACENPSASDNSGHDEEVLASILEVVSRLFVRMSSDSRERIFQKLCGLIDSRGNHRRPALRYSSIDSAFHRLIKASPFPENEERIARLMKLPMVNDRPFAEWTDPLMFVEFPDGYSLMNARAYTSWQPEVRRLLRLLVVGEPWERDQAIQRLFVLSRYSGLSAKEMEYFADGLWERRKGSFPEFTSLQGRHKVLAELPSHATGNMLTLLRAYLLRVDYPGLVVSDPDRAWTGLDGNNLFQVKRINSWIVDLTAHPDSDSKRIAWTQQEAMQIFRKTDAFLDAVSVQLRQLGPDALAFNALGLSSLWRSMRQALCYAVAMFASHAELSSQEFETTLGKLDALAGKTTSWAPFTLLWTDKHSDFQKIEDSLAEALLSGWADDVQDACEGTLNLLALADWNLLPRPPSARLLDCFLNLLARRGYPLSLNLLSQISTGVQLGASTFSEHHRWTLARFLHGTAERWTAEPSPSDMLGDSENWREARGDYLVLVTRIAGRVCSVARQQGDTFTQQACERVLLLASQDPWPEIRREAQSARRHCREDKAAAPEPAPPAGDQQDTTNQDGGGGPLCPPASPTSPGDLAGDKNGDVVRTSPASPASPIASPADRPSK